MMYGVPSSVLALFMLPDANALEVADRVYRMMDRLSRDFGAYLQSLGLQKGDRIALMMPNIMQYPVAILGALRAGLVVVNTNPMYTARELKHQLTDSGARCIIILENFAHTLEKIIAERRIGRLTEPPADLGGEHHRRDHAWRRSGIRLAFGEPGANVDGARPGSPIRRPDRTGGTDDAFDTGLPENDPAGPEG